MPKKTATTKKNTKKSVMPAAAPAPEPEVVEEEVPHVEDSHEDSHVEDSHEEETPEEESHDVTMTELVDTILGSLKLLGTQLREMTRSLRSLRSEVNKREKADARRAQRRKTTGKKNTNGGFQRLHNIEGTPLEKHLGKEASMVDAHRWICAHIKGRTDVDAFPGDGRIIILDDVLDEIFPGLVDNYPAALEVAAKAMEEPNPKTRRGYLNANIDMDKVLTYAGIMKRLPKYFPKETAIVPAASPEAEASA